MEREWRPIEEGKEPLVQFCVRAVPSIYRLRWRVAVKTEIALLLTNYDIYLLSYW